ncbi:DNA cytosine methyltransferase [Aquimarina sp. BL5]|uniref:DNA cytosine methyltransferase n=1 Tax=Aquimarina sp. BL5 TaxID=1714860 RepID=UPI000E54D62F|nr:DNA cytosine methyltransferase [Aquimarina sp. BL5]AXT50317.1 DNA cytosine methyltransferase [Aquimarina sp. BL5]RKM90138.1 DNA (cytosine-5-)-methyltransferase [Aquimarina sp. BL5]
METVMQFNIGLNSEFTSKWVTRSEPKTTQFDPETRAFNIVDLFCGCGGLTAGIVEACIDQNIKPNIALALDFDPHALKVYKDNFSSFSDKILLKDIREIFPTELNDTNDFVLIPKKEPIDLLVAGPPCQGHSDLNNSTRRNDPRNNLYLSCLNAIRELKPDFVLIENVPTVIHAREKVVSRTKEDLEEWGYEVREVKIDFVNLGLPQTRKRHVLLASRKKDILDYISFNNSDYDQPKLIDFIKDLESRELNLSTFHASTKISEENSKRINFLFKNGLFDLPDSERPKCHKNGNHSYKSNYGRLRYDSPAQTITSGYGSMGQGRYVHPTQKRTITSNEAARIQGFPDDHIFSGVQSSTALRKMIANAVPPQLGFALTRMILEMKNKNESQQW